MIKLKSRFGRLEMEDILDRCEKNKIRCLKRIKREELRKIRKYLLYMISEGHIESLYKPEILFIESSEKDDLLQEIIDDLRSKYSYAEFIFQRYGYMGSYTGINIKIVK